MENPFKGYLEKLELRHRALDLKPVNPIREIVSCYFRMRKLDCMPPSFYHGRYGYGKMASEAKKLYTACGENLDDCIWALDKMKYLAEKGNFDWSIITCLKHKLT
jgi:hypothetical protein